MKISKQYDKLIKSRSKAWIEYALRAIARSYMTTANSWFVSYATLTERTIVSCPTGLCMQEQNCAGTNKPKKMPLTKYMQILTSADSANMNTCTHF